MAADAPQSFNDGVLAVYSVTNTAEPGNKPVDALTPKIGPLRYQERRVGVTRYYAALQANAKVDAVVRVLRQHDISTQDVVVLRDGQQYNIRQVQHPAGDKPKVTDLTLERIEQAYKFAPLRR